MNEFDVVVIGAGIVGISHAFHSVKAGLKVALIERNDFPRNATVRNFGQVVPSGMNLKWQHFGRESLRIYKEIQQEYDITVRHQGSIYLASDQEEMLLLEELAEINKDNDYSSILYGKDKCLAEYPGLNASYVKGGLFFPDEINIDPRLAARKIIEYLGWKYGLVYQPRKLIKNIVRANGSVHLTTADGELVKAGKVFLCSGAEFQILYPDLFFDSDLVLVKLQMMQTVSQPTQIIKGSILTGWTIRRYESFRECTSFHMIAEKDYHESFQQKYGVHILFKQNPDGSVIIGDSHEYAPVKEIDRLSFDINLSVNRFMLTEAAKIFDLESFEILKTWNGYYTQGQSNDIFEKTLDDHIHIITGIGGKGMTASLGYAKRNVEKTLALNIKTEY